MTFKVEKGSFEEQRDPIWVYVQHIEPNGQVWVMHTKELHLMKHIFLTLNTEANWKSPVNPLKVDNVVGVFHDGIWYRAKILSRGSQYKVLCIDFGFVLDVNVQRIVDIPEYLIHMKGVAMKITLAHLKHLEISVGSTILVEFKNSDNDVMKMDLINYEESKSHTILRGIFMTNVFNLADVYGPFLSAIQLQKYFELSIMKNISVEKPNCMEEFEDKLVTVSKPITDLSNVVFIKNLCCKVLKPDYLFNICGLYGKVLLVKVMPYKGTAFITMSSVREAMEVITKLNNLYLMGSRLDVSTCKFGKVYVTQKEFLDETAKNYEKRKCPIFIGPKFANSLHQNFVYEEHNEYSYK